MVWDFILYVVYSMFGKLVKLVTQEACEMNGILVHI